MFLPSWTRPTSPFNKNCSPLSKIPRGILFLHSYGHFYLPFLYVLILMSFLFERGGGGGRVICKAFPVFEIFFPKYYILFMYSRDIYNYFKKYFFLMIKQNLFLYFLNCHPCLSTGPKKIFIKKERKNDFYQFPPSDLCQNGFFNMLNLWQLFSCKL